MYCSVCLSHSLFFPLIWNCSQSPKTATAPILKLNNLCAQEFKIEINSAPPSLIVCNIIWEGLEVTVRELIQSCEFSLFHSAQCQRATTSLPTSYLWHKPCTTDSFSASPVTVLHPSPSASSLSLFPRSPSVRVFCLCFECIFHCYTFSQPPLLQCYTIPPPPPHPSIYLSSRLFLC